MSQIPEHLDDVGHGWHPILARLHGQLLTVAPDYAVGQVKEKFGGLRVYLDQDPEDYRQGAEDLVAAAENESYRTCESCGAPGRDRHGYAVWIKTLCDECDNRRLLTRAATLQDASIALGKSLNFVRKLIALGELRGCMYKRKQYVYRASLAAYMEEEAARCRTAADGLSRSQEPGD